jgi:hypothetical protein
MPVLGNETWRPPPSVDGWRIRPDQLSWRTMKKISQAVLVLFFAMLVWSKTESFSSLLKNRWGESEASPFFYSEKGVLSLVYEADGENTVLELLHRKTDYEFRRDSTGVHIKIHGIAESADAWWLYCVNNTVGEEPADIFVPKKNQAIVWRYNIHKRLK